MEFPEEVQEKVFDLMFNLDATEDQLDFPTIYGSAKLGWMNGDYKNENDNIMKMVEFAKNNQFGDLVYLIDDTQEVAKKYGAVCTPDFFGYNKNLELQYRGRYKELKNLKPINNEDSDLKVSMKMRKRLTFKKQKHFSLYRYRPTKELFYFWRELIQTI